MELRHFGHSCVLVDTGRARLLFDPGTFSTGFESLTDLDAVLVTHQHADHVDTGRLPALLAANPDATLVLDSGTATDLAAELVGLDPRVVAAGDRLDIAGATVTAVGGDHAVIHPDFPIVANVGYLVDDGAFYHPGDSLFVPEQDVDVLGLPVGAPWLKIGEAVDFQRAVHPRVSVPIHERLLSDIGAASAHGWLGRLAPAGTTFTPFGETATVSSRA